LHRLRRDEHTAGSGRNFVTCNVTHLRRHQAVK